MPPETDAVRIVMPPEADAVKIVMTSSKYDLVDLDYIYYREDHCGVKFIFLLKKTRIYNEGNGVCGGTNMFYAKNAFEGESS